MDITLEQIKNMKVKQLRNVIRESILEIINEQATIDVPNPSTLTNTQKQADIQKARLSTRNNKIGTAEEPVEFVEESELSELARIAKGFKLADPNFDSSPYINKKISGVSIADVIEYFRENPGAEKIDIKNHFNFARPQITNALVNSLMDAGVLVKLGAGGEIELPPAPGEEPEPPIRGGQELLIGPYLDWDEYQASLSGKEKRKEREPGEEYLEKTTIDTSKYSKEDFDQKYKFNDLYSSYRNLKSAASKYRMAGREPGEFKSKETDPTIAVEKKQEAIKRFLLNSPKGTIELILKSPGGVDSFVEKTIKQRPDFSEIDSSLMENLKAFKNISLLEDIDNEDAIIEDSIYEKRQLQYRAGIIK